MSSPTTATEPVFPTPSKNTTSPPPPVAQTPPPTSPTPTTSPPVSPPPSSSPPPTTFPSLSSSTSPPPLKSFTSPPPPTTHSSSSPPLLPKTSNGSNTPSSTGTSNSSIFSTTAILGVAVVGVVACFFRKKKERTTEFIPGAPRQPSKDDYHGGRPQYGQNNAPQPGDNAVKIRPPSSPLSHPVIPIPPPSPPDVMPPPPPPQPVFSSGDDSSSGFSGSKQPLPPPSPGIGLGISRTFTYEDLEAATNGFSRTNLLGEGGFGYVYKGILPGSKTIAVKKLKFGGSQGEREFQAEVEIISRVHHRHLVSLVGYCIAGRERLLVYEFVPNDTLDHHLHGKGQPTMDWPTRLKIATGVARGLAYLHEDCYPKIIHRDIKASNILLDSNFEAKVADFGLAKLVSEGLTHVTTRVMGTFGYFAPEYFSTGKLTDKSDVYSFGVMLLELITGRQPESLVLWARPLLARAMKDGNVDAIADIRIQHNYNVNEMMRVVACAASCVRKSARKRPRMGQIARVLESDVSLDDLDEGVRPGHSTVYGSTGSSDDDNNQYSEDTPQEHGSDYRGATGEYGLNQSVSGRHPSSPPSGTSQVYVPRRQRGRDLPSRVRFWDDISH